MINKQIKDYQRKYFHELSGHETFVFQEVNGNFSITKNTTLNDILNKGIDYTYNIVSDGQPYPYKQQLDLNELILIKDISTNNSGNQIKYTSLLDIKNNLQKEQEFITHTGTNNITLDFSLYSYFRINATNSVRVNIDFIGFNKFRVQEIRIEAINFFNKDIQWNNVPNNTIKKEFGYINYSAIDGTNPQVIDLIKIISTRNGFIAFIEAQNLVY